EQSRKVDERSLERVVKDLSGGDGDWLAAVFRLRAMLHSASRLWCFHFALGFSMLSPLGLRLWAFGCVLGHRLVRWFRRRLSGGGFGRRLRCVDELWNP